MLGYLLREEPRELYSLSIEEGGFEVTCSERLSLLLLEEVTNPDLAKTLADLKKERETHGRTGTVTYSISLPFITYTNLTHKKADWRKMETAIETLHMLLGFFNMRLREGNEVYTMSDKPQLIAIESFCFQNGPNLGQRGGHVSVGFSPAAKNMLAKHWVKGAVFTASQKRMVMFQESLNSSSRRAFERNVRNETGWNNLGFTSIVAGMRDYGIPFFQVFGNCACLGAASDRFEMNGELNSHNIDTPLQTLTMLAGIVSVWNDEIKPLFLQQ